MSYRRTHIQRTCPRKKLNKPFGGRRSLALARRWLVVRCELIYRTSSAVAMCKLSRFGTTDKRTRLNKRRSDRRTTCPTFIRNIVRLLTTRRTNWWRWLSIPPVSILCPSLSVCRNSALLTNRCGAKIGAVRQFPVWKSLESLKCNATIIT